VETPRFQVRLATDDDTEAMLDVCGAALGWSNPTFDSALFRWKHMDNAFGRSAVYLAEDSTGVLAVRPFMQWQFQLGDETIHASRAVDTATRPDAQGRGLFRTLTEYGLTDLQSQGHGFVFNTPNDKSRPGYLKMGWVEAGRVGFGVGLRSIGRVSKIIRSRTAAEKPSLPTPELGIDVMDGLDSIDTNASTEDQMATAHTSETLAWRYAGGPIEYRWLPLGDSGGCVVRLRARGLARELVIAEVLGSPESSKSARGIVREALRTCDADYCIAPAGFPGTVRTDRVGPTLTLRRVTITPRTNQFRWAPGDIELF
jgi:hypothetical protein